MIRKVENREKVAENTYQSQSTRPVDPAVRSGQWVKAARTEATVKRSNSGVRRSSRNERLRAKDVSILRHRMHTLWYITDQSSRRSSIIS